jgi:hypothetical protein
MTGWAGYKPTAKPAASAAAAGDVPAGVTEAAARAATAATAGVSEAGARAAAAADVAVVAEPPAEGSSNTLAVAEGKSSGS